MQVPANSSQRGDGHLWVIALALSLLANLVILAGFGFVALEAAVMRQKSPPPPPAPPGQSVVMIFPEAPASSPPNTAATPPAPTVTPTPPPAALPGGTTAASPRFARTSEDQRATRPENPTSFGERDTLATSERPPTPGAPPIPSQAGVAPKHPSDLETTTSDYQDGSLNASRPDPPETLMPPTPQEPASPTQAEPALPMAAAPPASAEPPEPDSPQNTPPPRAKLLEGPNPVDVPVQSEVAKKDEIKAARGQRQPVDVPSAKTTAATPATQAPKPKTPQQPEFKGFQRKTAVVGSISRTGRSSLDVADSPLGRYQAALSRAVEQEWQRNCVRHRDYITPGFLTVRFFVEPGGKVRSVQFVGDMETGEVQKGFTLNAIRDAEIPAMPAALRKEYDKEPLELIFRFYF